MSNLHSSIGDKVSKLSIPWNNSKTCWVKITNKSVSSYIRMKRNKVHHVILSNNISWILYSLKGISLIWEYGSCFVKQRRMVLKFIYIVRDMYVWPPTNILHMNNNLKISMVMKKNMNMHLHTKTKKVKEILAIIALSTWLTMPSRRTVKIMGFSMKETNFLLHKW